MPWFAMLCNAADCRALPSLAVPRHAEHRRALASASIVQEDMPKKPDDWPGAAVALIILLPLLLGVCAAAFIILT
jgi:hypothetical protein